MGTDPKIINPPIVLAGRLEGFMRNMPRTADARVIVALAKEELSRRSAEKMLRLARFSLGVSIARAFATAAAALTAWT